MQAHTHVHACSHKHEHYNRLYKRVDDFPGVKSEAKCEVTQTCTTSNGHLGATPLIAKINLIV